MARRYNRIPLMKFVATGVGLALCCVDTWLNADHIAHIEGRASSLVAAVVVASIGAAAALPLAERAAKTRQAAKAAGLALFFLVMVAFSFCTSVERIGGKLDGETASARSDNERVKLLHEGYDAAKKTADAECAKGQTKRCRTAEETVNKAREGLSSKPSERVVDSMAVRISAALPFLTAADGRVPDARAGLIASARRTGAKGETEASQKSCRQAESKCAWQCRQPSRGNQTRNEMN